MRTNDALVRRALFAWGLLAVPALTLALDANEAAAQSAAQACSPQALLRPGSVCEGDEVDDAERTLLASVNAYRAQRGLPPVALSGSLSVVANRHVRDLSGFAYGSLHDWSDCLYRGGSNDCMWRAPQRLGTRFPGNGYEIATGYRNPSRPVLMTPEGALTSWQGSSPHNAVLLSEGMWASRPWRSVGVGMYGGFAVMWFAREADPEGSTGGVPSAPVAPSFAPPVYAPAAVTSPPMGFVANAPGLTLATAPPSEAGPGDGLVGEYFADPELRVPAFRRVEPTVRFDWGAGAPAANVPADHFSARWSGHLVAPASGAYQLTLRSEGGVRLYAGNALLLDRWRGDARDDPSVQLWLEAGEALALRVEYAARDGGALCELRWQPPGAQGASAVPRAVLFSARP